MQHNYEERAQILVEALPYIKKYSGETVVVKYGGNAMINEDLKKAVIDDIVLLSLVGIQVVVVHGGGPEISDMLKRVGKEGKFVNGLRYTDEETMEIVQMVLCGKVNKELVSILNRAGGSAIGLCGMDGGLFRATQLDGGTYGLVGEIQEVETKPVTDALKNGYIPVVSTVAQGLNDTQSYNINADTAAAKLASALGAKKLILLTDVCGILEDPKDESTLISDINVSEVPKLVRDGIISGGMIPKLACCVEAVRMGVSQANILDGRVPHSILMEMLSDRGIGTVVHGEMERLV
ncbi:MAG: acetylglutamate kinase [Ruminococcaceae bacterium]|nr:acetylglutamate kinase [Oscillospiraceae bacterium]